MEAINELLDAFRQDGANLRDTPWGPAALDYGDWEAEYWALRRGAGLFRPPSIAQVEATGSQRAEFLNRLSTNKLDQIRPGDGVETFFADANGRILHHVIVWAEPQSLVLQAAAGTGPSLISHLDYYVIQEDVQLRDCSAQCQDLILAGPRSVEIIKRPGASTLPRGESYLANEVILWNGTAVAIRQMCEVGQYSFHLSVAAAHIANLWRALRQESAVPCGVRALETFRIEEGFPVIGLDIGEKTLPQEVGRNEKAISFTKGCYLGQEIVARIDSRGAVNKVLSGLLFETNEVPQPGDALTRDGQPAGQITSAAYSPAFSASVALAYVRRQFLEPGTALESTWGPAKVVRLPMRGEMSRRSD